MMANKIKALVSKEKKRYKEGGYDLDLTYINSKIIAMGYPAEKLEGVYRNNIDDVVRFLDEKHWGRYRVYNLCAERSYDVTKFHNRVITFPLEDHNPPRIELFDPFCRDMDQWLTQDDQNVAVVHCKAGKGRTGVMICAYLLHSGTFLAYEKALAFYGQARTKNHKGVTIPSQRRYVQYFGYLRQSQLKYEPMTLLLKSIEFSSTPSFNNSNACTPFFVVNTTTGTPEIITSPGDPLWNTSISAVSISAASAGTDNGGRVKLHSSAVYELKRGQKPPVMFLNPPLPVCGDIQVEFYNKSKVMKKERMCHFWFNTFFVYHQVKTPLASSCDHNPSVAGNGELTNSLDRRHEPFNTESLADYRQTDVYGDSLHIISYTVPKEEIDKANKDTANKLFSQDMEVKVEFIVPSVVDTLNETSAPEVTSPYAPADVKPVSCSGSGGRLSHHHQRHGSSSSDARQNSSNSRHNDFNARQNSGTFQNSNSDSDLEPSSDEEHSTDSSIEWTEDDKIRV